MSARDTSPAETIDHTEAAARIEAILEAAVDGIITIDEQGIIESANPAALRMFGYSADEMLGRNVRLLMPSSFGDHHDQYIRNYLDTGESKIIGRGREVVGLTKDGREFPMDLAIGVVEGVSGRLFTGIVRDITERKEVERIKAEFVSTVSHELRTPLTSVRGSLGLLSSGVGGELNEQVQSMVDIALKNCERLVRLVNDILDIEKIEAGKMDYHFEEIDLVDLVAETIVSNEGFGVEHGVTFAFTSELGRAPVTADSDRMVQVVTNLLSNAAKFSPAGESVDVSVTSGRLGPRVEVTDRGPGIPEEFRPLIFSRFARDDSSDARSKGGTGLGLSICRSIVTDHGGRVGFESEVGVGTTFFLELPEVHR